MLLEKEMRCLKEIGFRQYDVMVCGNRLARGYEKCRGGWYVEGT